MAIRLFVGNLPQNVTEADLREHFSTVGPLSYISVPIDRETGRQRGFAFIEFRDRAQADEAKRSFNNKPFKGNVLSIKEAYAKDDRPPSRPSLPRADSPPESQTANPPGPRPSPNFGPDASPHRSRAKAKGKPNSERAPKGPMREVVRGQFFGEYDGEYDDEYDDDRDYHDDGDYDDAETSSENFDGRENDSDEDNPQGQSSGPGF